MKKEYVMLAIILLGCVIIFFSLNKTINARAWWDRNINKIQPSTKTCSNPDSIYESGEILVKTKVTVTSVNGAILDVKEDYCSDDKILQEAVCLNTKSEYTEKVCEGKCANGRCTLVSCPIPDLEVQCSLINGTISLIPSASDLINSGICGECSLVINSKKSESACSIEVSCI